MKFSGPFCSTLWCQKNRTLLSFAGTQPAQPFRVAARVTGNNVDDCSMSGILVTSTAGLHLESGTLHLRSESGNLPQKTRQAGLKEVRPVIEIQCEP
jgi:hypothetical protein